MTEIVLGKCGASNVKLDLEVLLRTRLLVQANSGGGKSWLLRRMAEQFFGKIPLIIIDPEGEFATLRERFGFVLVGQGGETPADVRSAALVAEKLLELRASAVCDLFEGFRKNPQGRHQWVKSFLEALLDAPKRLWRPVVIIIDEAHVFCPEKGESAAANAMIGLATAGRKRGFCPVWATQRLALLSKSASSQLMNRLVGMTFEDVDIDRAVELLSVSKDERHEFKKAIKVLGPGYFHAFGRAISKERLLIRVGPVQTTHPEPGSSSYSAEPPPPPEKIKALLPKLADLPKAAEEKARTEADLRAEIRSLKSQLATRPKETVSKIQTKVEHVEVSVLKDGHCLRLEQVSKRLQEAVREISTAIAKRAGAPARSIAPAPILHRVSPPPTSKPRTPSAVAALEADGVSLGKAQRKILAVLAHNPDGCLIGKLALLTGYCVSGGFRNVLGYLRMKGAIIGGNTGLMRITPTGHSYINGEWEPLPQGLALVDYWLNHPQFGKCERSILGALVKHPDGLSISDIAQYTGYQVSGGLRNSLGALRTAGVIVGRNNERMKPSEELIHA